MTLAWRKWFGFENKVAATPVGQKPADEVYQVEISVEYEAESLSTGHWKWIATVVPPIGSAAKSIIGSRTDWSKDRAEVSALQWAKNQVATMKNLDIPKETKSYTIN